MADNGEGLPAKQPSLHLHDSDFSWHEDEAPAAEKGGALKVAIVSTPHSGHMIPVLHIAAELVKNGNDVTVYTADFGVKEFEKKVHQIGAEIESLDTEGATHEKVEEFCRTKKEVPFIFFYEMMRKPLKAAFLANRPDVVLADFVTFAGMEAAEEIDVPLVINLPGPLAFLRDFIKMSDVTTAFSFCGFHFSRTAMSAMSFGIWMNAKKMGSVGMLIRRYIASGALVLVQTVWTLDQPMPLFPNIVVTGPVLPAAADLRQSLARNHPELSNFLNSAGSRGVVYVTTGSLAQLKKWQVEAIYLGLKKANLPVVWSLKEKQQEFLPRKDDPNFYISKWTPQAELLQSDAVKAVITHCGWGGTLECVTACKPVIAIPFFGDQPTNARLLVKAGVGELIGKVPSGGESDRNSYKEGDFTPETVAAAVMKIIGEESYSKAVQKMSKACRACGGAEAAVQQIEWAAAYGTKHLKSDAFLATTGTSTWSAVAIGLASAVCAGALMAYMKRQS